ncbi:MAG TPA: HlyD family secretion protein [Xanthobacteraceae bacterium]|nr:HlyD family secretion protein [Xanthobacteraceae bacterium]
MANPALKLAPDVNVPRTEVPAPPSTKRPKRLRFVLLVVVPLIAAVAGLALYLAGGRYITTDNAYVGAQKVLITPDISGKVSRVLVQEGQHVAAGDALFEIDPEPFRLALNQAQAKVASARTDFANLKTNHAALGRLIDLAQKTVELKQRDLDRKNALVANRSVSLADVDISMTALVAAQNQLEQLKQQQAGIRNQLLDDPDLPLEKFPAHAQAQAALDQAERDLAHTTLRAPIAGTATQVDNIQLGRFVAAGTPVLSVIDDAHPWVDANPKETDITYLQPGQKVTIDVDTFPNHTFRGTVAAISPGTGAQFAILPPQNASGNWVKVVQRVPVRIAIDASEDVSRLRAGMSATVSVDTGRSRSLAKLFGLSSVAQETR